jgi:hypothetical protein
MQGFPCWLVTTFVFCVNPESNGFVQTGETLLFQVRGGIWRKEIHT